MKTVKALVDLRKNDIDITLHIPIKSDHVGGMIEDILNSMPEEFMKKNTRLMSIYFFEEEIK